MKDDIDLSSIEPIYIGLNQYTIRCDGCKNACIYLSYHSHDVFLCKELKELGWVTRGREYVEHTKSATIVRYRKLFLCKTCALIEEILE